MKIVRMHPNVLKKNREDFETFGGYSMFAYMGVEKDGNER